MFTVRFHFAHYLPVIQAWHKGIWASIDSQTPIPFATLTKVLPLPPTEPSKQVLSARGDFMLRDRHLASSSENSAEAEFPVPDNGSIWLDYAAIVELDCVEIGQAGCRFTGIKGLALRFCRAEVFPGIGKSMRVSEIRYADSADVRFLCSQGDDPNPLLTLVADFNRAPRAKQ